MNEASIKQGEVYEFERSGQKISKYIPLSSEDLVIIPSNKRGTGFMRNRFRDNKRFIGGLIDKTEFNQIIDSCSKLTALAYSKHRKLDVEGIPSSIVAALALSSLLLISYFFLMYYGIRDDNYSQRIAGYVALAVSVSLTSLVGIRNCLARPDKYMPFKDMV